MSKTIQQTEINNIINYLIEVHNKHADGCKGSCNEREIGFHNSTYYESYWYCRFGGYCLGDLSRNEEVKSSTLEALLPLVKTYIEAAIVRNEAFK